MLGADIHACSARGLLYIPGRAIEAAAYRKSMTSISERYRGLFPAPEPIAAEVGSCANDLTGSALIIRLSADNGTIRQYSARSCGLRIRLGKAVGSVTILH
uniref:Uncharacterized protein n=1 Tax=Rhizobium leguminosarum TaxID=384 RepID=A0A179BCY9_RHILE|nr:hypothetical protein A4U53_07020 [Rhizobium leguminosarum]